MPEQEDVSKVGVLDWAMQVVAANGYVVYRESAAKALEQNRARVAAVRALHPRVEYANGTGACGGCSDRYGDSHDWPCPTIAVLDGADSATDTPREDDACTNCGLPITDEHPGDAAQIGRVHLGCPECAADELLIVRKPGRMSGRPTIGHSRLPLTTILEYLRAGDSVELVTNAYPSVTAEQVRVVAALRDDLDDRDADRHPREDDTPAPAPTGRVGICGDVMSWAGHTNVCDLPVGHEGWHQVGETTRWSADRAVREAVEKARAGSVSTTHVEQYVPLTSDELATLAAAVSSTPETPTGPETPTLLVRFRAASQAANDMGYHGTAHTLWDLGSQLQPGDTPRIVLDAIEGALLAPAGSVSTTPADGSGEEGPDVGDTQPDPAGCEADDRDAPRPQPELGFRPSLPDESNDAGPVDACRGGSLEWPTPHPGVSTTPADEPATPRPVYADPDESTEGWDEEHDRPIHDSAGWDLSWGCSVTIGHNHAYDGDPERWTATVSLSDEDARKGIVVREVTPDQVRAYAAHLVALVDRHAPVSTTPDPATLAPSHLAEMAQTIEEAIEHTHSFDGLGDHEDWLLETARRLRRAVLAGNPEEAP